MKKLRIDLLLVERSLAESRSKAQRLIMAGQVKVDGQVVQKASISYPGDVEISVDPGQRYVSRGGEKLEAALSVFQIDVAGLLCADVGASTGGFTDCLLQHGASKVFSIDVGKGILHWNLRNDERVVVMEGINARKIERLPDGVDLVTIDASFISSKVLLPVVQGWFLGPAGQVLLLIKPQFEAGKSEVSRGKGVIRDAEIHKRVLIDVLQFAQDAGFQVSGLIKSPLLGPKGNQEFLAWFQLPIQAEARVESFVEPLISGELT